MYSALDLDSEEKESTIKVTHFTLLFFSNYHVYMTFISQVHLISTSSLYGLCYRDKPVQIPDQKFEVCVTNSISILNVL